MMSDPNHPHWSARAMKMRLYWRRREDCLRCYMKFWTPSSWACFKYREGCYVLFVLVVLLTLLVSSYCMRPFRPIAFIFAGFLAVDIVLANTAIVFVTGQAENPLRSAVLTIVSYFNLALAFGVAWIWFSCAPLLPTEAIYESLRTLSTAGLTRTVNTATERILATVEQLTGVYFLVLIFAIYASWARTGRSA